MMKRFFPYLFLCLLYIQAHDISAQAFNTEIRSNWDDASLPMSSGLVYNDIWGYADDQGREYAIIGSVNFTHFIDITDPDNPVEIDRIAGGNSCVWRDFKTYGHYAYGVGDYCNEGLEIFDLSGLPQTVTKIYDSDEFFNNAHNVFIDTAQGKLYASGFYSGLADIIILDLNSDPAAPTLIKNLFLPEGMFSTRYVHDLFVRNDTAYCSFPNSNKLEIYDFSLLPLNPVFIAQISSTGYNHSSSVSDDGNTILIADETFDAPVLVADITDIENPSVVSSFKSDLLATSGSIAHNPFIVGDDFVVLSYYDDGLQIYKIDSTDDPFMAGYYDTFAGATYSSNGAWGAYPYLPSGNLIASDILNGLFVITPHFPLRDCLEQVSVLGSYDHHWDLISKDQLYNQASYHDSAELILRAPQDISLLPNFSIEVGSTLEALIEDACSTTASKSRQKPNLLGRK